ncbi:leukocyte receptor cluster lrc member 1 [Anaeramoeba ignava]|uniref:Leukocyte receptor cluster lrc member 1 n=1 Tax=Anaeramoeba ignava TaxID=1746090 RepID=A0A9Q0LVC4_ANAIG|nr:leukocyte receptor cluster lrc member 1 [Anaeramoeba ignava]
MSLNILPHKNWNVYSLKNIQKVKEDERKFKEKEEKKQTKKEQIEREARYETLLRKAGIQKKQEKQIPFSIEDLKTNHINLFQENPNLINKETNEEYEKEKKEEEKKLVQKLTTFLGQSSVEMKKEKPWYQQTQNKEKNISLIDERRKQQDDPLSKIQRSLAQRKLQKDEEKNQEEKNKTPPVFFSPLNSHSLWDQKPLEKERREEKKKRKKNKHKEKEKEKKKETEKKKKKHRKSRKKSDTNQELLKLRQERLLRESQEREKIEKLKNQLTNQNNQNNNNQNRPQQTIFSRMVRMETGGSRLRSDY